VTIIPQKLVGDCRISLLAVPERSVHLCVTSPPYWRLREYLPKGHPLKALEIGQEETFDLYLEHLIEVFAQVRRVLRDDGAVWINLGDRYTSAGRHTYDPKAKTTNGSRPHPTAGIKRPADIPGLKGKDLCLVPQRVAIALQNDGWFLRSMIPWVKRNTMPESTTDRPANAIEYLFMFSKSEDCYYDRHAVTIEASPNTHPRASVFPHRSVRDDNRRRRRTNPKAALEAIGSKQNPSFSEACDHIVSKRNRRNSDWFLESWVDYMLEQWQGLALDHFGDPMALVVNPKGTDLAHFASYPYKLPEPIILACTSERGACPICGAPLIRMVEDGDPDLAHQKLCGGGQMGLYTGQATKDYEGAKVQNASDVKRRILAGMVEKKTTGWVTSCDCLGTVFTQKGDLIGGYHSVPCTVLDPFHGTGKTAEVALALGRRYIGCEINEAYLKLSNINDSQTAMTLL
jgi:DNA modification methylase